MVPVTQLFNVQLKFVIIKRYVKIVKGFILFSRTTNSVVYVEMCNTGVLNQPLRHWCYCETKVIMNVICGVVGQLKL